MIENISYSEHELVVQAREIYDDYYLFAEEAVNLLRRSFVSFHPNCDVFLLFLSQIDKCLTLSFLSTIRKHDIQSSLMLRFALESAVFAGYSLYKTDVLNFVHIDDEGFALENRNIKKQALKWIEEKYNLYSISIKNYKDMINSSSAHSNILSGFNNFRIGTDDTIHINFFDDDSNEMVKERLWWIGNITFCITEFLSKVISDFPLVKLHHNFEQELFDLWRLNNYLENQLITNPIYKRVRDNQIHFGA